VSKGRSCGSATGGEVRVVDLTREATGGPKEIGTERKPSGIQSIIKGVKSTRRGRTRRLLPRDLPRACRAARRVSRDEGAAEDAALEALTRAFVRWPRLRSLPYRMPGFFASRSTKPLASYVGPGASPLQ